MFTCCAALDVDVEDHVDIDVDDEDFVDNDDDGQDNLDDDLLDDDLEEGIYGDD